MKSLKILTVGSSVALWLVCQLPAQTYTKTQTFDSQSAAALNGWVELGSRANNMNYGYNPGTAYAGGSPDEAGGYVARNQIRSMYADVFGSYLTLTNTFSATGRVAVVYTSGNAALVLGHSDSSLVGQNKDLLNTIGVLVTPATGVNNILNGVVGLANASITGVLWTGIDVSGAKTYTWSYSWNPTGGTSGNGALTLSASDGINTSNLVISITAAQKAVGGKYDSFGLTSRCLAATAVYSYTYVDNLQYTALPSCIRASPSSIVEVPGQNNVPVTVAIPALYNTSQNFYVTVTSTNPAIAEPVGATGGSLTLVYPAGGANAQTFYVNAVAAGTVNMTLANTNGVCFGTGQIAVTVGAQASTIMKAQSFDTATSALTNGWVELGCRTNGQNFGFSATSNAGGPAGEAGGFFKRDLKRALYADLFGGKLTLNDYLHASGTIIMPTLPGTNAGPVIGYGDSSKVGLSTEANLLGLECGYSSGGVPGLYARLVLTNGTSYEPALLSPINLGTVYYWDYTYDPTGGASFSGALTVNLSDGISGTNTTVITLTSGDRIVGAQFDCFGVNSRSLSADTNGTSVFVDNVNYTAPASQPCVRFLATTASTFVWQTNVSVSVSIPPAANANSSFPVTVTSLNPDVAVPLGAGANGSLVLTFPVGSQLQTFRLSALKAGTAVFALSNAGGFCVDSNVLTVTVPCSSVTTSKSESFDTVESASAHGWVELGSRTNGQDFGFSATANAGGPAGEAGGTFARTSVRSCYVDVYGAKLTLNDYLTASGKIILPGAYGGNLGPIIGHSDSTTAGLSLPEANNLGLNNLNGTTFYLELILADGTRAGEVALPGVVSTSTVYDWNYVYDPTGGPTGNGSLTVNVISGGVTNTAVYNLSAANRATGAQFDCFGMTSRALSSSAATGPAYIDNVTYTVPIQLRVAGILNLPNGNLRLTITTPTPCGNYVIQAAPSLSPLAWTAITNVAYSVLATGLTAEFAKPADAATFYRVILLP